MTKISDFNMVTMLGDSLEARLKETVLGEVMDSLIKDFKSKAEPLVKEEVEKISLKHVKSFTDMTAIRDELIVHLKWEDS
jgi:predicted small metal-binding protein